MKSTRYRTVEDREVSSWLGKHDTRGHLSNPITFKPSFRWTERIAFLLHGPKSSEENETNSLKIIFYPIDLNFTPPCSWFSRTCCKLLLSSWRFLSLSLLLRHQDLLSLSLIRPVCFWSPLLHASSLLVLRGHSSLPLLQTSSPLFTPPPPAFLVTLAIAIHTNSCRPHNVSSFKERGRKKPH